jgi:hypothetical protein
MASSSGENGPEAYYGFSDVPGCLDFVGYVILYAPDMFPHEDWLGADEQMNLDRAFDGLRYGLSLLRNHRLSSSECAECSTLVESAFERYRRGADVEGQRLLEEFESLLKRSMK